MRERRVVEPIRAVSFSTEILEPHSRKSGVILRSQNEYRHLELMCQFDFAAPMDGNALGLGLKGAVG